MNQDRRSPALAFVLVAAHLVALGVLASTVPWTPDERGYFLSGRNLLLGAGWEVDEQRFQGPLGLLANQLFAHGAAADPAGLDPVRTAARLGMLVFPAALLGVIGLWARQLWGTRAALLALFLAATSPTLLAYGPLLAVDVALTTTATATFWVLWLWLRRPSAGRLGALGAALGAMLATKYTAMLLAVVVPLCVAIAVVRGVDPTPSFARREGAGLGRRAAGALGALAIAGVVALLVLNACYLFRAPLYDASHADALTSGALRAVARLPGGAFLLGLLPDPFVLGADYQATVSRELHGTFLDYDHSHWAYYPASLLTKTPLGTLGLWALAMIAPARPRAPRLAGLCLGAPAVVLLGYLSVASSLQMGVRYLLPVIPLLIVRAGAWAASGWAARPWGKVATAIAGASCLWAAVSAWPHHIGYFNALVGGPAGGFRLFADGNCDWNQRYHAGKAALAAEDGEVEFLRPGDDPRLAGRIAAYALDLKPADPERPGRTYHWITRFPVVGHDSAAWLVFDVSPGGYEDAIAAGDVRAARDLALAWLRRRDFAAARAALARAPDDARSGALRAIVDRAEAATAGDGSARRDVVARLSEAGHAELALSFLGEAPRDELPELFVLMVRSGRLPEAIELLRARVDEGPARPIEVLLLAAGLFWQARPVEALAVMERYSPPAAGDPLAPVWQAFLEDVRKAVRAVEELKAQEGTTKR